MPHRIKSAVDRVVLCKLLMGLTREVSVTYLGEANYGPWASDVILTCGVFVGQAEGKPLSVSALARFVGMPRPSVYRKLKEMEKKGLAKVTGTGGRATLTLSVPIRSNVR